MGGEGKWYVVLSPRDIVIVKPRDRRDHVAWLVERKRYEEALEEVEKIQGSGGSLASDGESETAVDAVEIGQRYIEHLVGEGRSLSLVLVCFVLSTFRLTRGYLICLGSFAKAARLCPKVCAQDPKRWEDWIWVFAQKQHLQVRVFKTCVR